MSYMVLNAVPILAAGAAGLLLLWLATRRQMRGGTALLTLLGTSWMAAILAGALILAPVSAGRWTIAFGSALIIWIGFVLPALAIAPTLRGQPLRTSLADALVWLAVMLVEAAVLQSIGLVRPV